MYNIYFVSIFWRWNNSVIFTFMNLLTILSKKTCVQDTEDAFTECPENCSYSLLALVLSKSQHSCLNLNQTPIQVRYNSQDEIHTLTSWCETTGKCSPLDCKGNGDEMMFK